MMLFIVKKCEDRRMESVFCFQQSHISLFFVSQFPIEALLNHPTAINNMGLTSDKSTHVTGKIERQGGDFFGVGNSS